MAQQTTQRIRFTTAFDPARLIILMAGVGTLIAVLAPPRLRLGFTDYLVPLDINKSLHVVLGFLLVFISYQIALRKTNAWFAGIGLLSVLLIINILSIFHPGASLLYIIALMYLLIKRDEFVVKSDLQSLRQSSKIFLGQFLFVVVYSMGLFLLIDERQFAHDLSLSQAVNVTLHSLTDRHLPYGLVLSRTDQLFMLLLQTSLILGLLLIIWNLFRPIILRSPGTLLERSRAEDILRKYSDSSEDYFKLFPDDKHYYFYGNSFLAYHISNGVAVILDGPSGDRKQFGALRAHFDDYSRLNGWAISLVHADEREASQWEKLGFERQYIGGEAIISIQSFVETTRQSKHFRYIYNRAAKSGLETEMWRAPLSDQQVDNLRAISNVWVENGKKEYTFVMAPFSDSYIRHSDVMVLKQAGHAIAYVNLVPQFQAQVITIDHMRYRSDLPQEGMHYLLAQLIMSLQENGPTAFNLGFVPLSRAEQNKADGEEGIATYLRKYVKTFYGFSGLEQFKNKFEPDWDPRFVTYRGGSVGLVRALTALNSAITYKKPRLIKRPLLVLAIISSITYCSFLLAHFIVPNEVHRTTLVSGFGQSGVPFNWLFNSFDIISGLLMILVVVVLRKRAHLHKLWSYCLTALFISGIGTIGAALVPLPANFTESSQINLALAHQPLVLLHGLFSFMNTIGICVAIALWSAMQLKNKIYWRVWFGVSILAVGIVGLILGRAVENLETDFQQVFIIAISTWFVVFIITALHRSSHPSKKLL